MDWLTAVALPVGGIIGGLVGAWWAKRSSKTAEIGILLNAQLEALYSEHLRQRQAARDIIRSLMASGSLSREQLEAASTALRHWAASTGMTPSRPGVLWKQPSRPPRRRDPMAEVLDSGHVITDEDVDTARLIMELDRALGRPTDSLTEQVAATPAHRVRTLLEEPPQATSATSNGHQVPAADDLLRTLTSEQSAAELAREVQEQLPADMDPAEQARVASRIEDVIRRRMIKLVTEVDPGH